MLLKELFTDREELDFVYSFNYTSIAKICKQLKIENSDRIRCVHIHGSVEDHNLILGVDDSRVSIGYEFLQKTVNVHYRSTNFLGTLATAYDILIFGNSFGRVDIEYFKPFFEYILKQDIQETGYHPNVVIFYI